MAKKKESLQYAALPYVVEDGRPRVLLVTSRETKRWILPKGKPEKNRLPHEVALREAFEEAGLKGTISSEPFARFLSTKRLASGREIPCAIEVYLMEVTKVLSEWPEMHERERQWATPGEAAMLSSEAGLVSVLLDFSGHWE